MSNSNNKKAWLSLFRLFIGIIKTTVLVICILLIYTFFGEHFEFNSVDKVSTTYQASNSRPNTAIDDWNSVENGIHVTTGLAYDNNFDLVRANCTGCHSGKLIAQNRATREGWRQMIRWMQKTQGLWDLGSNEPKILDYLVTHYAPQKVGRRANIDMATIEWYILELETAHK